MSPVAVDLASAESAPGSSPDAAVDDGELSELPQPPAASAAATLTDQTAARWRGLGIPAIVRRRPETLLTVSLELWSASVEPVEEVVVLVVDDAPLDLQGGRELAG